MIPHYLDLRNCDNMELMAEYPDKYFDLAIVDPPYGIGFGSFNRTNKDSHGNRVKADAYKNGDWDSNIPSKEYFDMLITKSDNSIVWGGNYFPSLWEMGCKGFIFWHKHQPVSNFSKGELAWTSFDRPANCFDFPYYGGIEGNTSASPKYHPTQKPVQLYKWLLKNYAKPGDKILDTHLGSMSIAIAVHEMNKQGMNLTLVGCELDADYYRDAMRRVELHCKQQSLF